MQKKNHLLSNKINIKKKKCALFSIIDFYDLSEIDGVLKIVIKDNFIYYNCFRDCSGYSIDFINYIGSLLESNIVNDSFFYFLTEEGLEVTPPAVSELQNIISSLPSFMYNKDTEKYLEKSKSLLPDPYIIGHNTIRIYENWDNLVKSIKMWSKIININSKYLKAFWRGAPHSPTIDGFYHFKFDNQYNYRPLLHIEGKYTEFARFNLVETSKLYPDILDAKFTYSFLNQRKIMLREYENKGLNSKDYYGIGVPPSFHMYYKYLPSLDGTNAAWGRVEWIMFSNSILLKDKSTKIQWFYDLLEDYKNCIFIDSNIKLIKGTMEWCKSNTKIDKIITSANKFANLHLTAQAIEEYTVNSISKYTKHYIEKCNFINYDKTVKGMLMHGEDIYNGAAPYSVFKYMEIFNEKVVLYHNLLNKLVLDKNIAIYKDITINLDFNKDIFNNIPEDSILLREIISFNTDMLCNKLFTFLSIDEKLQFNNISIDIEKVISGPFSISVFEEWQESIEQCQFLALHSNDINTSNNLL